MYVYRETGNHAVQTAPGIGKRIPLHTTAAGKAILAYLPPERVDEILDRHGLATVTEYTITDCEKLFEQFEHIRERDFSVNKQENIVGLHAIGVPIREQTTESSAR